MKKFWSKWYGKVAIIGISAWLGLTVVSYIDFLF